MGSRKFGSLLFFVWTTMAALQLSALLSWPAIGRRLPSGPYAALGTLAIYFLSMSRFVDLHHVLLPIAHTDSHYVYLEYVPRLQPKAYSLLGLNFSDKSTTYLLLLVVRTGTCSYGEYFTDANVDDAPQILGRNPSTLLEFLPGAFLGVLFSSTPLGKLQLPSFICTILSVRLPPCRLPILCMSLMLLT
jgi:hypothetical protein